MPNTNRVVASAESLMNQASLTAGTYLARARRTIDEEFGKGYAEKHPELVGAFMQASARDFHTAILSQTIQEAVEDLGLAMLNAAAAS